MADLAETTRLQGTLRIIGVAHAARGRAVDIALIETDGGPHIRRIETERVLLRGGPSAEALAREVLTFMGNRALQPFAVDMVALEFAAWTETATTFAERIGVHTVLPTQATGPQHFTRAERIALGAVAAAYRMTQPPPHVTRRSSSTTT